MRNAKEELLNHIGTRDVEYISLVYSRGYYGDKDTAYKGEPTAALLNLLDFEYDSGYGGQELCGYIWYSDGTWSERWEYDGSEGWSYKSRPSHDTEVR